MRASRRSTSTRSPSRASACPEDVANAIHFLCSEEAAYINGHVLAIDGGWSVTNYSRRGDAL